MSKIDQDEQDEKPLDPVLERVRRKMIRLQVISASIMVVALGAVLVAIVYKANKVPQASQTQQVALEVPNIGATTVNAALPDGFVVSSQQLANGQILFDGKMADGTRKTLVFDLRVGRIVADIVTGKP